MKKINEPVIENLQKLSVISSNYEVEVYRPDAKGRIRSAESYKAKDEAALGELILNMNTKHAVCKLPYGAAGECRMDMSPAEGIILALQHGQEDDEVLFGDQETQPIGIPDHSDVQSRFMRMHQVFLVELCSAEQQQEHQLLPGRNLLGRVEHCRIKVYSREASRVHAIIPVNDDGVEIADAQTSKGTRVNGKFITSARLYNGDRLDIGEISYRVSFRLKGRSVDYKHKLFRETVRSGAIYFKNFGQRQEQVGFKKAGRLISELFQDEVKEEAPLGVVEMKRYV